jgi:hypothetical protein
MTEESQDMVAVKLDAQRRIEIDAIRVRMEHFLENQIELKHSMELVSEGQKSLKERFEVGTAGTLRELNQKFDKFVGEWSEVRAENKNRDQRISESMACSTEAKGLAEKAKEKAENIIMGFAYTIFGSLGLAALIWALALVLKRAP